MNDINSPDFLTRLQNDDKESFTRLVNETSGHIYHLCLRILGNPQDAEDIMQETYIKAFRSISAFEGRSSLTTWLYRIAVNEALMLVRRHEPDALSVEEPHDDDEENGALEIVDWCCLPEKDLLSGETRRFVDQAIQHLSPALKVVFILRDLENYSIQETSQALGVSESVVKTRLLRARLALRQELSHYFGNQFQEVLNR